MELVMGGLLMGTSGMLVLLVIAAWKEMNAGQMVEDVRLAVEGKVPVHFTGRMGGMIPSPDDVLNEIESILDNQNVLQD